MSDSPGLRFLMTHLPELGVRAAEHLLLTGVSTTIAVTVGVPLGIAVTKSERVRQVILGTASVLQTLPSLALLAFLLPLMGIGTAPALVALVLYALLPIIRNTHTGLSEVAPEIREAARGLGFTPRQQLGWVELPLALPVIMAGIRTAAVIGVGIATLAAAIGAGGLGVFIFQGLAMVNTRLILLGAVPAAGMALVLDAGIGLCQHLASRPRREPARPRGRLVPAVVLAGVAVVGLWGVFRSTGGGAARSSGGSVVVGSKNFTEQYVLGELMAQLIEARTKLRVERRLGLGGSSVCHEALVAGGIDLYAEYTGTALTTILDRPPLSDPEATYEVVAALYEERHGLRWLPAFGFNNTYALTVSRKQADARKWRRISDLVGEAGSLRAGFTAEFSQRPDGYPGLREAYGLRFGRVFDMDPGLMYQAVARGEVDVVSAFATDGRIAAYGLHVLEDDQAYFPPYYAAPVVRGPVLEAHPELREALSPLTGALTNEVMQSLNYEVDEKQRSPAVVAREFLARLAGGSR